MEIKHECAFEAMLLELADLYGVPLPTKTACGLWWAVLEPYPWGLVEQALKDHVACCKFFPRPADVVERLTAQDGRPSPDEAWAVALQAMDESATVVWCQEITAAWGIARPVMDTGDQIGARRTFLDAYTRLVAEARRRLVPAVWSASLGADAGCRQQALEAAVSAGRIERKRAQALLGSSRGAATEANLGRTLGRLSGNVSLMPNLEAATARRFVNAMQVGLKRAAQQQAATQQARQADAAGRRQAERTRQAAELDRLQGLADRQAVTGESSA